MINWEDEIKRYKRGEMTPEEEYALEKKALQDPFLAEALEGSDLVSETEFTDDLKVIQRSIQNRVNRIEVAAAAKSSLEQPTTGKKGDNQKTIWFWPLRIAATIILIVGSYLLFDQFSERNPETLAQQQPEADSSQNTEVKPMESDQDLIAASESKSVEQPIQPQPAKREAEAVNQKEVARNTEVQADQKLDLTLEASELEEESVAAVKQPVPEKITIQPQAAPELQSAIAGSGPHMIKGTVSLAEDGTPLPGVNIVIKGTTTGTITDLEGNYQLTSTTEEPVLVYSFVGLQTQEVSAKGKEQVNVQLQSDISQLGEVVVTGYSSKTETPGYEPVIKLAQPIGGLKAYDRYLKNSLRYPQSALDNQVKGRVTIKFTVRTDGSLDEFNVLKGLGYGCDEEVIRLVKEGPKWNPTTQDDVPVESEVKVRVRFTLPE